MIGYKPWNGLFSPMAHDVEDKPSYANQDGEFEAQVHIGSKLFSEYPLRSHREAYYQVQKNTGYAITRKKQFRYIRSRVSPIQDGHRH